MIFKELKNKGLIVFLILLIIIISFLSYQNANGYNELKKVFELEKKELETELNNVISDYESINYSKDDISLKLRGELHKIIKLRDTIHNLKAVDYKLIRYYRKKIANLVAINKSLFIRVDSLSQVNNQLLTKNDSVKDILIQKEEQNTELKNKNNYLDRAKNILEKKVATAEIIEISTIKVQAMKKRRNNKYTSTSRSNKTDAFKIEFTLLENNIIEAGNKPIYVQIINPNKKIINPNKKVTLKNKNKISCNDILKAKYYNQKLSVVSFINTNRNENIKGIYTVNIFVNGIFSETQKLKLK